MNTLKQKARRLLAFLLALAVLAGSLGSYRLVGGSEFQHFAPEEGEAEQQAEPVSGQEPSRHDLFINLALAESEAPSPAQNEAAGNAELSDSANIAETSAGFEPANAAENADYSASASAAETSEGFEPANAAENADYSASAKASDTSEGFEPTNAAENADFSARKC